MSSLALDFPQQLVVEHRIEVQHRQRGAAGLVSAQRHRRDVHPVIAQHCADAANDAGAVGVLEHKDDAVRPGFDRAAVDVHDARRGAEKCAGNGDRLALRHDREFQQVGVIARCAKSRLGHLEAVTLRESGRIHVVHVAAGGRLEKSFQHRARDCRGIDFVHLAAVVDVQTARRVSAPAAKGSGRAFRRSADAVR